MTDRGPSSSERVRAAEVIASMCLATDLGMGFPFEHGLHSDTLLAVGRDAGYVVDHLVENRQMDRLGSNSMA